jgi:anti-anti-sigma factor
MTANCRVRPAVGEPDLLLFGDPRVVAACFEDLPACVLVFERPEHVLAAANRAARTLLDPARRIVGRLLLEALSEPAGQRLADVLDTVCSTARPVSGREWRIPVDEQGGGGREDLYLDFTAVPIRAADGAVRGVVVHAIDVSGVVAARWAVEAQATAFEQRCQGALNGVMVLQRILLPERLPVLPGLSIAARYLVADSEQGAGGDWFDAIPLADGRLGLVVGDVVGSGTRAAAVMGQLRAVLLDLFLDGSQLPQLLARLDRFVARVPAALGSTVCVAVLDPADGRLDYACCAHPPPLVLAADGHARYLPSGAGAPLGIGASTVPAQVRTAQLQAGDIVLHYTNGLVERADRPLQQGLDLLRGVASDARAHSAGPAAEGVCERVLEPLTRDGHSDDATVLAVEWTGTRPPPFHAELPAFPGVLGHLRTRLDAWLTSLGGSDDDVLAVRFAVLEAVSNVIEHAYPDDAGPVRVDGMLDAAGRVCTTITDIGRWAEPPAHPGNRGRGLALMRDRMDTVEIEIGPSGTTVLMDRALGRLPTFGSDVLRPRLTVAARKGGFRVETILEAPLQVAVHGPIDLSTAPELGRRLQEASRGGTVPLTVDLTGVSHLASAGVQLIYRIAEQMAADGRRLQLVAPAGTAPYQILELTDLHELAHVVEDLPSQF